MHSYKTMFILLINNVNDEDTNIDVRLTSKQKIFHPIYSNFKTR